MLRVHERALENTVVMSLLNRCRTQQGDSPEIIQQLLDAVEAHPEDLQLLVDLGNTHYLAGRTEEARKVFERYLAKHPDNVIVANNLANVLADQDSDLARAEELSRMAVSSAPANAFIYGYARLGAGLSG